MNPFENLLETSAADWGITARLARRLFWLPLIATLIVFALQINRDIFRFLLQEDGPAEWLSAIAFILTGVVSVRIALNRYKAGHQWQAALFVVVALVMFFAGGEEVSWGQRIFGWETPEDIIE